MSLQNYRAPTAVVSFKGGDVEVRGITTDDIAVLLKNHLADVDALVRIINVPGITQENAVSQMMQNCMGLVREAPGLVANLIALASDEPDQVDQARKLGIATQVKVIRKIADLTFEEAGGPKNFIESLKTLVMGLVSSPEPTDSLT